MAKTFTPPASVARAAARGLKLRASLPPSKRCCTDVGIRRAAQLKNRQPVSVSTLKRMRSYFARHEVDKQGRGWGVDSKGYQAWLLWGGDPGRAWADRMLGYRKNVHPAFERAARRRSALDELLAAEPHPIVAPVLGGRYEVLVHRSTRSPGWWQVTFFDEDGEPYSDTESDCWYSLLETISMDGVDWTKAARPRFA